MDIADDIAYSLHDLDDFYRADLLNPATLSAEFRMWDRNLAALRAGWNYGETTEDSDRTSGASSAQDHVAASYLTARVRPP